MATVRIVENPTRRRKRRAGRPKRARARRRRNPGLAAFAANPRRRRISSSRSVPRRRNPGMGGLLKGIDLPTAAWVAGGMINLRVTPGLIAKLWKQMPTTGIGLYAVKLGSVFLGGWALRQVGFAGPARANQFMAGGLALLLFDAFNEYLAPLLGLFAMSGFVNTSRTPGMGSVGKFVNYNSGGFRGSSPVTGGNGNRVPAHVMYN